MREILGRAEDCMAGADLDPKFSRPQRGRVNDALDVNLTARR
jgi:hypothetical protein